jgi:hypothetical protein
MPVTIEQIRAIGGTIADVTQGNARVDALRAKVNEAISFYKKLQKTSLPDSILAVGDEVENATEYLVPKMNKDLLKKWNIRAAKIEAINQCLADFEQGCCEELTASSQAIIYKEVHRLFSKWEWIAGHVGTITVLLRETWESVYESPEGNLVEQKVMNYIFGSESEREEISSTIAAEAAELAGLLATSIGLSLMATVLESAVTAFSSASYSLKIVPVLQLKAATEQAIEDKAFPQGTKRKQKVRPHRIRAGA